MSVPNAYDELLGALRLDPWGKDAACIGRPDLLETPGREGAAKTLCHHCPVLQQCGKWVIGLNSRQDPGGVRAGMTVEERKQVHAILARRRAHATQAEKRCATCRHLKPHIAYAADPRFTAGIRNTCRSCEAEAAAEYRRRKAQVAA